MQLDKIKVAMISKNLEINGISAVIMNYCTHLDLGKFDVCLLSGGKIAESHLTKCRSLGIKIYELPDRKKEGKAYIRELNTILHNNKFDIVHVHGNQSSIAIELFLAWKNHVKVRIAHSHNTTCTSMKLHKIMKPLFNIMYTHGFACGTDAGRWLFDKKKFDVIPNGFDISKFFFDEEIRKKNRDNLKVSDKLVIGHIGRINEQKNQLFLVEVFEELAKKRNDAILLLVGVGPQMEEVKEKIENSGVKDRIILYGESTSPEELYMAMDIYAFPSRYEGLPVTLLEAQITGLKCFVSNRITGEVNFGQMEYLSIDNGIDEWVNAIINCENYNNRKTYYDLYKSEIDKYQIDETVKKLEELYLHITK